jgi:putative hydrolase of the HAD superfamily
MSKIEAIIFDVGGVLHESNSAMDDDLFQELGINNDTLSAIRASEMPLLGSGELDEREFWDKVHANYGVRPVATDENLLGRAFGEAIEPHTPILELAKELGESGIKLAILSNTIEPHAKALKEKGIYSGFDYVFLSHELGMRKPDPAIYEHTLEALKTTPEATIFVDDDPANVEVAESLGINGVVYTDADSVIEKIRAIISSGQRES